MKPFASCEHLLPTVTVDPHLFVEPIRPSVVKSNSEVNRLASMSESHSTDDDPYTSDNEMEDRSDALQKRMAKASIAYRGRVDDTTQKPQD